MRILIILIGILFVSACSHENLNEQHEIYLSNKGWEIKNLLEVETYILNIPDEMLRNYEASDITFLSEHLGEEVTHHSYDLREEDAEGKSLKAVVFEVEGEVIGGDGVLPNWDPGIFNLDDKERLINEQMIK